MRHWLAYNTVYIRNSLVSLVTNSNYGTRQTAVECFKLKMAVAAAERFFVTFLVTRDYSSIS